MSWPGWTTHDRAQILALRYFGGLSEQEVAAALSLSRATVTREWQWPARAWLYRRMTVGFVGGTLGSCQTAVVTGGRRPVQDLAGIGVQAPHRARTCPSETAWPSSETMYGAPKTHGRDRASPSGKSGTGVPTCTDGCGRRFGRGRPSAFRRAQNVEQLDLPANETWAPLYSWRPARACLRPQTAG